MKVLYSSVFLLSFIFFSINIAGAAPRAGIVASVNGEMISSLELEKAIDGVLSAQNIPKSSKLYKELADEARPKLLQSLIDEKLLLFEAQKQSITASAEEVKEEIAINIKRTGLSEANFYKELDKIGLNKRDYEEKIKSNIITQKFIGRNFLRKISVSEDEIMHYYQTKWSNIGNKTKVEVAIIMYPSTKVALKHGESLIKNPGNFNKIVKSTSVGSRSDGGSLGYMSIADLAPPIQFQVKKMRVGEVSAIFSLGNTEAQIKLLKSSEKEPSASDVIAENVRNQIESRLRQEKVADKVDEYIQQIKSKAIISIK